MSVMNLTLSTSLSFDGHCEEAFKFYERCMNGKITFMLTWGDSPMAKDAPAEWGSKINHATLVIGNARLLGNDVVPGAYQAPRNVSLVLGLSDPAEAERIFSALAENGTVQLELQQTFWALRFGLVTDRFGVPWAINCESPQ
jgi:PhnB protein